MTNLERRPVPDDPRVQALVGAVADELERRTAHRAVTPRATVDLTPAVPAADSRLEAARAANRASIRNAAFIVGAVIACALALLVVKGLGAAAHSIGPATPTAPVTTPAAPR